MATAAHPCPNCGWSLRWDQTQWACDRCGNRIAPQPAQQSSGLAPGGWQQPVQTNVGIAPAGGSFGGSAASSSPVVRSPSQPPGLYSAPAQQRPQSASQPNYAYGQAPPGQGQPPSPYGNAGFGGSATAATPAANPSQFGVAPYPTPQPGGFGGSATAAQPQDARARTPSSAPGHQPQPQAGYGQVDPRAQSQPGQDPRAQSTPGYGPGGYPSYTPPPASADDLPKAAKKSKRGLFIAIGAVVAIGAGIAIAVVASKGGGAKPGLASADEVTTRTLSALTAGDVDGLIALVGAEYQAQLIVCEDDADKQDPTKAISLLREIYEKAASKAKGLSVELVKVGAPKSKVIEKGKEMSKGCKSTADFRANDHELVVKVKSGDKPAKERTVRILLGEIDGRWFLTMPPKIERPGDCPTAVKRSVENNAAAMKKLELGASAKARLEKAALQHCTEDGWSDEIITCFEDATGPDKDCFNRLTTSQQEKAEKHYNAIITEDAKSREVPTVAETPTTLDPTIDPTKPAIDPTKAPDAGSGAGSGSGSAVADVPAQLPPICDEYKAQIDKLGSCRRMKASMKKAQREAYETIVEGWNRITKKTEAQYSSFENICKRSVDALVDLRKTLCR